MKTVKIIYYYFLKQKYWKIQLSEYLAGFSNTKNYYKWLYYKNKYQELIIIEGRKSNENKYE